MTTPQAARRWKVREAIAILMAVSVGGYILYSIHASKQASQALNEKARQRLQALRDNYQPKNLTFSAMPCEQIDTQMEPEKKLDQHATSAVAETERREPRLGVLRQNWKADGSLEVFGRVTENCGRPILAGRYAIGGADLVLNYLVVYGAPGVPLAACMCNYDLHYNITDMKKQSYKIKLEPHCIEDAIEKTVGCSRYD